jgi:hypothetical protein
MSTEQSETRFGYTLAAILLALALALALVLMRGS